mmetsp:Transcript_11782/g.30502  ORF Transcript_11782/g.30502 Transcript_11782/m.30502 type:complete len:201 (-) Transcript_11782:1584-2186(-)
MNSCFFFLSSHVLKSECPHKWENDFVTFQGSKLPSESPPRHHPHHPHPCPRLGPDLGPHRLASCPLLCYLPCAHDAQKKNQMLRAPDQGCWARWEMSAAPEQARFLDSAAREWAPRPSQVNRLYLEACKHSFQCRKFCHCRQSIQCQGSPELHTAPSSPRLSSSSQESDHSRFHRCQGCCRVGRHTLFCPCHKLCRRWRG